MPGGRRRRRGGGRPQRRLELVAPDAARDHDDARCAVLVGPRVEVRGRVDHVLHAVQDNADTLKAVLLHHVVAGAISPDQLAAGELTTAAGDKLTASRDVRIRFQVGLRARTCETWMPLWRVASIGLNKSPEVSQRIAVVRERFKSRLESMYAPELATLEEPQRTATLIALDELTSFEGWARMREQYGLDYETACNSWIYTIDRLLPLAP